MNCTFKHTVFQADGKGEWKCPKCNDKQLIIADSPNHDCEMVHDDDEVLCEICDYSASGKSATRLLAKAAHVVTCPTCKGKGVVPEGKIA